jgi:hypothetical protein
MLLDGVCVIGELREVCWAAPVVWLVSRRHVGMSLVVAVLVLRAMGVYVAGGGCASVAAPSRCVGECRRWCRWWCVCCVYCVVSVVG